MKKIILFPSIVLLTLISQAFSADKLIKLTLAYPPTGSAIAGQIGLVLEKTETLKIYGFDATIKKLSAEEAKKEISAGKLDLMITTESSYVNLADKNVNVAAISTLGIEDNFQLVNVINKSFSAKNPKAIEKINGAFIDAFYYLTNHKAELNKQYADLAKMSPAAVDAASKINKNYNAKKLSEINIKIQ